VNILEFLSDAFSVVVALIAIPLGALIWLWLAHLVSGELLRAIYAAYNKVFNPQVKLAEFPLAWRKCEHTDLIPSPDGRVLWCPECRAKWAVTDRYEDKRYLRSGIITLTFEEADPAEIEKGAAILNEGRETK
jgi:hypothetical protein